MATTTDASVINLGRLKKYNENLKSTILDPMDAEVKANAADITGIEGLTYGTGKQKFVEKSNGSYSSPALVEIQHEIENVSATAGGKQDKLTAGSGITLTGNTIAVDWSKDPNTKPGIATSSTTGLVKGGGNVAIAADGTMSVNLSEYATTAAMNTALAKKQNTLTFATDDDIAAMFS